MRCVTGPGGGRASLLAPTTQRRVVVRRRTTFYGACEIVVVGWCRGGRDDEGRRRRATKAGWAGLMVVFSSRRWQLLRLDGDAGAVRVSCVCVCVCVCVVGFVAVVMGPWWVVVSVDGSAALSLPGCGVDERFRSTVVRSQCKRGGWRERAGCEGWSVSWRLPSIRISPANAWLYTLYRFWGLLSADARAGARYHQQLVFESA